MKDEYTYLTLDALTSDSAPALKLMKLDPKTQLTKSVVMGYPLGGGGHALRHTSSEGGNSTSYCHGQRHSPSPSRPGQLGDILTKTLHARAPPLLPLPAVWPPPEQLLSHPGMWNLQPETLKAGVTYAVQRCFIAD